jgi:RNA polymerase sigma factor (sigma-70 family)
MTAIVSDFDQRAGALGALAYRVGYRILGEREDARDVTQETLARAYAHWSRVGPYDEAWVTRVATNLALDAARARDRSRHPERAARVRRAAAPGPAPTDLAASVVQRRELVSGLRRLSRRQREVVAMRYLADLPEAEVAAALGCSVGTVKQHASRGLAALRKALEPPIVPEPTSNPRTTSTASSPPKVPGTKPGPIAPEGASS